MVEDQSFSLEKSVTDDLNSLNNLLHLDDQHEKNRGRIEEEIGGPGDEGREVKLKATIGSGLEFEDLTYTVVKKQKVDGEWISSEVDLLRQISGQAPKGQVTAIMGPSGAGKSTLLDALAGRIAQGSLGGTVSVDGKGVTGSQVKRMSAYVMQQDFLFPMLTVKETLMFSAEMRLPSSLSRKDKVERVQQLMQQLGLQNAANTIIGDEGHRGVSGGERRRVSIGVDIIHRPPLLFLDEPTSGLDSTSAMGVMEKLYDIANSGSTVTLTIHQPSHRIQIMLSRVIVLARGQVVYSGAPDKVTQHLKAIGKEVPEGENSMEYLFDVIKEYDQSDVGLEPLIQFRKDGIRPDASQTPQRRKISIYGTDLSVEFGETGFDHSLSILRTPLLNMGYLPAWSSNYTPGRTPGRTPNRTALDRSIVFANRATSSPMNQKGSADPSSREGSDDVEKEAGEAGMEGHNKYANGWLREMGVLMGRNLTNIKRTPELFLTREIVIFIMCLIVSSLFKHPEKSLDGVNHILAFLSFCVALIFFSSNDAVPAFIHERSIFIREIGHDAYRASSYTIAGFIINLPFLAVQAITMVLLTWFIIGLAGGMQGFLNFWLILFALFAATNSFVMLVSAMVPNYIMGFSIVISLSALFFLTCGYFVKPSAIPVWWKWLHFSSAMTYAYEGFIQNEFVNDDCFSTSPILPNPGPLGQIVSTVPLNGTHPPCYLNGRMIRTALGVNELTVAQCIACLVAWCLIYRFLFYIVLRFYSSAARK